MTSPSSGTVNAVTAILNGVTAAQITAAIIPGAAMPAGLKPGARPDTWADSGLANEFNVIYTQANLVYRM